jgi:hypothetical protein
VFEDNESFRPPFWAAKGLDRGASASLLRVDMHGALQSGRAATGSESATHVQLTICARAPLSTACHQALLLCRQLRAIESYA